MKKRAQISFEASMAVGFVVLVLALIMFVNFERKEQIQDTDIVLEERDLCLKVSNAISTVYSKGPGTVINVDFDKHNISVNANTQRLIIDDEYYCTFPLKEVANEFFSREFTVTLEDLRIENIDNTIFINQQCTTNIPKKVQDQNGYYYTSQVTDDDDNYAALELVPTINDSISDYGKHIINNGLRIALVYGGDDCKSEIEKIFNDFNCKEFNDELGDTNCDHYKDKDDLDFLYDNIDAYSLILFDDEKIDNAPALEAWVNNGGILILSKKILKKNGEMAGINWIKRDDPPNPKNLTATLAYYDNPDPYLTLGGNPLDPATFEVKKGHYVINDVPSTPAYDYRIIADFIDDTEGLATWKYGDGLVYYFASICAKKDGYNHGILTERIESMIKDLIGSYQSGYLNSTIPLRRLEGATSINNMKFNIRHYRDNANLEVHVFYQDGTDLKESCILYPTGTETSEFCSIPTETILGDEMPIQLNYFIPGVGLSYYYVDYQDIKICYNFN